MMTNPRSKSETLSKTAEAVVFEQFVQDRTGRRKVVTSKYMDKGIYMEEDSITLLSRVLGKPLFKNSKFLQNDFLTGTPDIITNDTVIDIKTSWDVFTFYNAKISEIDKGYYAQLQGYMNLTGKSKAELIYCLVDAPHWELNYAKAHFDRINPFHSENEWENHKRNFLFEDIKESDRIHRISVEFDSEFIDSVKNRVLLCRKYYNELESRFTNEIS